MLWSYAGATYQQAMVASLVIEGQWNSQRTKDSHKIWHWTDFHPAHRQTVKKASGQAIRENIRAAVMASGSGWEWAPGYGPGESAK